MEDKGKYYNFAARNVASDMVRKVIDIKEKVITTISGQKFIRRVTKVQMPNGKYRYPVDYYDANPGTVQITPEEQERRRIPVYQQII